MHGANSQNNYKQISNESHVLPFDLKIYIYIYTLYQHHKFKF